MPTPRRVRRPLPLLVAVLVALLSVVAAAASAGGAVAAPTPSTAARSVCGPAPAGFARCFAEVRQLPTTGAGVASGDATSSTAARPLTPADVQAAYGVPVERAGTVVGIVDAYDNPNAEADLTRWRARYGLPACTTTNGCFRKVSQRGQASPLPTPDPGWGVEIALDLDAVSAACPRCSIVLVEADYPSVDNLGAAVQTAVRLGAKVVSNSYGAPEFSGMAAYAAKYYRYPGVSIVASTGDDGFRAAQFPAVLTTTLAVGGTTLYPAPGTARGWTERAWSGAGSGCSAYITKPAWQHDTHCLYRTTSDVSAVADSASGLIVEDTYEQPGAIVVGGTSLAAPLVAGMSALSTAPRVNSSSRPYTHPGRFTDVVGGSNGFCGHDYLCTGLPGYDGPTGVGTPKGVDGL